MWVDSTTCQLIWSKSFRNENSYATDAWDSSPPIPSNYKHGGFVCVCHTISERGINLLGMMVVMAIGFSSYASETTVYSLRCVEVKETHLLPGGRAPENTRARVPPPCVCVCVCVCVCTCVWGVVCVCLTSFYRQVSKCQSHTLLPEGVSV